MPKPLPLLLVVSLLVFVAARLEAAEAGVRGVVVYLPTTDGAAEAELAAPGTAVVRGLALDAAAMESAREHLREAGVHGVATIAGWEDRSHLPFADHLVNVLMIDADALKAAGLAMPADAEVARVIAPGGLLRIKNGGTWSERPQPMPDTMDVWTHYDGTAFGNAASTDTAIDRGNSVRWIAGPSKTEAGSEEEMGFRLGGGQGAVQGGGRRVRGDHRRHRGPQGRAGQPPRLPRRPERGAAVAAGPG